jgi:serine phosphatase RsbU (regulator of sigma subunit)
VMVRVTRRAVPRLGDWCSIHVLPRRDSLVPEVEIAHVDPAMVALARDLQEQFPYDPDAPTGVAHVIRTGETLFYPDITDEIVAALETTDEAREMIERLALRSAIVVPLIKRGRVLGAMQFVMSSSSRRYTEDDVALARAVAGRIASSLENLRLHDQQRLIAQTLQRSLLPASLPDIPGVEVAVRYWPVGEATEAGGDFYDVFALETAGRWAVVIGDVCGTGPDAAALTALARHTIRDSAWHGDPPVAVLDALNRAVRRSGSDSFLTAVYAVLDTSGTPPQLIVTSGGHPLPVLARRGGTATIGVPGTLLGVLDDAPVHPVTVALAADDVVVFYTDGATDIPPPHGLDEVALAGMVEQAAASGGTADDIAERMRGALEQVQSFERREDDIALLVLRVADPVTVRP